MTDVLTSVTPAAPASGPPGDARATGTARAAGTARAIGRRAASAGLLLWLLVPLAPVLLWAAADRWAYPAPLPTRWGLGGWDAASAAGAGPAALRSLAIGLLVAALATPAGAAAGRVLALHPPRFARLVTAVLLAPVAVPPFAIVMGLGSLALRARVPESAAVVAVLVVAAIPYTTFVMRAAYAGYDAGFEEAARALGADRRRVLWRVRLPLLAPALVMAGFLAFLVAWSDYVVTLVLGGGRVVTLQQLLGSAAAGSGNDATVAVLALVTVTPPLLLVTAVTAFARKAGAR